MTKEKRSMRRQSCRLVNVDGVPRTHDAMPQNAKPGRKGPALDAQKKRAKKAKKTKKISSRRWASPAHKSLHIQIKLFNAISASVKLIRSTVIPPPPPSSSSPTRIRPVSELAPSDGAPQPPPPFPVGPPPHGDVLHALFAVLRDEGGVRWRTMRHRDFMAERGGQSGERGSRAWRVRRALRMLRKML